MLLACIFALGGCAPRQGTAVAPTSDAASNDWQRTLASAQVANDEQAWNLFDDFLVQYPTGLWTEAAKAQRDLLTEALYAQAMKQGNRALTGNNPAEADAAFKRALHWKPADPWATQAQTAAQALAMNPNRPVLDNMPSQSTQVGGATDYVVEGRGFGKVQLGMTGAELRAILGEPDRIYNPNTNQVSLFYDNTQVDVLIYKDHLRSITCRGKCTVRFPSGLGIGSPMEQLFNTFGRPRNNPPYESIPGNIGYGDQDEILYESSSKFLIQYLRKGVRFWISKSMGNTIERFDLSPPWTGSTKSINTDPNISKPSVISPKPSPSSSLTKVSKRKLWSPEQAIGQPDASMGTHSQNAWVLRPRS